MMMMMMIILILTLIIDCIDYTSHLIIPPCTHNILSCFYEPGNMITPKCFPVTKVVRYRAVEYGVIRGEHDMMKELINGPITCGIACNPEFSFHYTSGTCNE